MSTSATPSPRALPHHEAATSRRDFLMRAGGGFGALALTDLMGSTPSRAATLRSPLSARTGHHHATAKSVIFLFMEGGPSHIDLFDPKPMVNKMAGKPLPESLTKGLVTAMGEIRSPILGEKRKWKQHGQSGLWVSDWLPHTAGIVDEIAVVRSLTADGLNHVGSVCQMNTGSTLAGRPSVGSWMIYGLGSENQSLPGFVVLLDNNKLPHGGKRNWGTGFMNGSYQGVRFTNSKTSPIPNLKLPGGVDLKRQRRKLDLLQSINRPHADARPDQDDLEARIAAHELAFRMQMEAPKAVDLTEESAATKQMYGMDQKHTSAMAYNCLLARRMVERGVRFVQIYCGSGSKWDAHSGIEKNHSGLCRASDQPVAALVKDLKQRGLLEDTLVVWGGEFGRTPMSEKGNGRDHNPFGFSMWLAGGGVQGGQTIGTTDDFGLRAQQEPHHIRDLHASILHAMGLNHMDLTYANNGRRENLTINEGGPILKLFGA
jgi:hypothetical protein